MATLSHGLPVSYSGPTLLRGLVFVTVTLGYIYIIQLAVVTMFPMQMVEYQLLRQP